MKIMDFRYRLSTRQSLDSFIKHPVYAEYIKRTPFASTPAKSMDECIDEVRSLGIVKAVYTGRDCETTYHFPPSNDLVEEAIKADPDLFIGFWGVDPHKKMPALRELRDAVENRGMRGASIEPCMAHIRSDHALYYPLYAACCDLDIPVVITAGLSPFMPNVSMDEMRPTYIDNVARDFPDLRILISHGGYPWMLEAIAVIQRNSNVYLDFSTCLGKLQSDVIIEAANTSITDKVLFASANPFVPVAKAVAAFQALPLSDEAKEKISYSNGCTFLGL